MIDLKRVLMELGNELVLNHGFQPALGRPARPTEFTTEPIRAFAEFLNAHPEAEEILKCHGVHWEPLPAGARQ